MGKCHSIQNPQRVRLSPLFPRKASKTIHDGKTGCELNPENPSVEEGRDASCKGGGMGDRRVLCHILPVSDIPGSFDIPGLFVSLLSLGF